MNTPISVVPDDAHLECYLEYPRPAHPAMKEVFVEAMTDGLIEHLLHGPRTKCVFRRTVSRGRSHPPMTHGADHGFDPEPAPCR